MSFSVFLVISLLSTTLAALLTRDDESSSDVITLDTSGVNLN